MFHEFRLSSSSLLLMLAVLVASAALLPCAPAGAAPPVEAAPAMTAPPVSLDWTVTLTSKYLFQGIDYSDGKSVLQPDLTLGYRGLSTTLWVNHDLHLRESNELDFTVQYSFDLAGLSVSPGYGYYRYPNRIGWEPSQEVILDLAADVPAEPSLSFHRDIDAGDGLYATLGIGTALPMAGLPLHAGMSLHYQGDYYGMSGIPSLEFGLGHELELGPWGLASQIARFTTWENGDFRGAAAIPDSWLFSISLLGHN